MRHIQTKKNKNNKILLWTKFQVRRSLPNTGNEVPKKKQKPGDEDDSEEEEDEDDYSTVEDEDEELQNEMQHNRSVMSDLFQGVNDSDDDFP